MRLLLGSVLVAVAATMAVAQDSAVVRACDQPATKKVDAAFYGQVAVIPPEDSDQVGSPYLDDVGEAIRESIHPGALALNEYLVTPYDAMLTAEMTVVFTVAHDGRVRDVALASSSLSPTFDRMIVDAIRAADTSGLMPPLPSHAPSRVEFALSVFGSPFSGDANHPTFKRPGHVRPLFVTSLPSWTGSLTRAWPDSNTGAPKYPSVAAFGRLKDSILVQFAIDENGHGMPESVFVLTGQYWSFTKAIREWLPTARYIPARIGTCAVKSVNRQAFKFNPAR